MIVETVAELDDLPRYTVIRPIEHDYMVAVRSSLGWDQSLTEYFDQPSSTLAWLLPAQVLWFGFDNEAQTV